MRPQLLQRSDSSLKYFRHDDNASPTTICGIPPTGVQLAFTQLLFIFLLFRKDFHYYHELPHDTIPASRSDDNRRAAGAVDLSAFGIHYIQTNSLTDWRPGGEALVSSRVHSWFNHRLDCGMTAPFLILCFSGLFPAIPYGSGRIR